MQLYIVIVLLYIIWVDGKSKMTLLTLLMHAITGVTVNDSSMHVIQKFKKKVVFIIFFIKI